MKSGREENDEIGLTKAVRAALRAEQRRTGISAFLLLSDASDRPDGLDARTINRWIGGLIKAAPKAQLEYVLTKWAMHRDDAGRKARDGTLVRRGRRHPKAHEEWIEVTVEMAQQLRAEFARTGLDAASVLSNAVDVPEGLTARIVKGWLYRDAATTDAAHWEFVASRLTAEPDFEGTLPPLTRSRK